MHGNQETHKKTTPEMRKLLAIAMSLMATIAISCGDKKTDAAGVGAAPETAADETDSTLYGLAGDGCSDTLLYFISLDGDDPVAYDISGAVKGNKIIGRLETGDYIAVVVNPTDSSVADMVINLDQLKGSWVYKAMPTAVANNSMVSQQVDEADLDSLLRAAMVPNEQGFAILRDGVAEPVGKSATRGTDDVIQVTYPEIKSYTSWRLSNGRLLLSRPLPRKPGGEGDTVRKMETDTIEFEFMIRDSLQLRFGDGVRSYYRKGD